MHHSATICIAIISQMNSRAQQIDQGQPLARLVLCLMMLTSPVVGFQPQSPLHRPSCLSRTVRKLAPLDPNELVHHHSTIDAVLSTLYSVPADVLLKPAHGHSQPLFGPPDAWLSSGHSIAPNLKALQTTVKILMQPL